MTTPFLKQPSFESRKNNYYSLNKRYGKKISASVLIQLLHDLEDLEITHLESLVLEGAVKSGFVTKDNSVKNIYRRAWIKKVTEHANDA
ncbi:hypothetical protein [Vibrio parahaemolyticus]|uniref:hypothetical protein n=1 Tax=Vibrio parahaemolyticus TaxID=670 RepID=UPI001E2F1501|nr:hypothetical protein [Vibrio parahaemolyticus]HCH2964797.1 hypothetical protein [Vibrio parahaemolyticus]HCM1140684.1 hypothetical protein [Vibrio parahaemolyticus]HCM1433334.1 hypothetical protein [Vibrio parahaemolyticus]HCM1443892.1 hypothetical protein [Vibrio parahaemolyticus]